jgi:hypothetical protein
MGLEIVFDSTEVLEITGCTPGFLKDLTRVKIRRGQSSKGQQQVPFLVPAYASETSGKKDYYDFGDLLVIEAIKLARSFEMSREFAKVVIGARKKLDGGSNSKGFLDLFTGSFGSVGKDVPNKPEFLHPSPFCHTWFNFETNVIPDYKSLYQHNLIIAGSDGQPTFSWTISKHSNSKLPDPTIVSLGLTYPEGKPSKASPVKEPFFKVNFDFTKIHLFIKQKAIGKGVTLDQVK